MKSTLKHNASTNFHYQVQSLKTVIQHPYNLFYRDTKDSQQISTNQTLWRLPHTSRCPTSHSLLPPTSLSSELPDPITLNLFYRDKAGWARNWAAAAKLIVPSFKCQARLWGTKISSCFTLNSQIRDWKCWIVNYWSDIRGDDVGMMICIII